MAHVHDHHAGGTTVVESDREGPAMALMVLIGVIVLAALIWFFAFSGVVYDRGGDGGTDININRNDNPPAQQNNDTTTNNNTSPNPVPS